MVVVWVLPAQALVFGKVMCMYPSPRPANCDLQRSPLLSHTTFAAVGAVFWQV
jgi:hypothetical protein